jgi:SAM-dependent methyltransferase
MPHSRPEDWLGVSITVPTVSTATARDKSAVAFYEVVVSGAVVAKFRYSQLKVLHGALTKELGAARLASFPTSKSVEVRRRAIETYLQHLCKDRELSSLPKFTCFMRLDSIAKGLSQPKFGLDAPWWVAGLAVINPIASGHMVWSSLRGKIHRVGDILDNLSFQEGARVLDVGCGHGLMTIQALRRHPDAHVTALDHWSAFDQAGNSREALESNLIEEFVHDKVTIVDGDARQMPLPSGSFDVGSRATDPPCT